MVCTEGDLRSAQGNELLHFRKDATGESLPLSHMCQSMSYIGDFLPLSLRSLHELPLKQQLRTQDRTGFFGKVGLFDAYGSHHEHCQYLGEIFIRQDPLGLASLPPTHE